MINEVDETLRSLMKNEVLAGTDVDVVFDAPTRDWASRRNKPTLNLYLYDIREDLKRQQTGIMETRDEDGRVLSRGVPPTFFKLSYLVTAWTQRPEDEHRLLSATLATVMQYNMLPEEHMSDLLRENEVPLLLQLAYPPPENRQVSDVWTSLGGDLKPSIDLVVTMPLLLDYFEDLAQAVLGPLRLQASGYNTSEAEDEVKSLRPSEDGEAQSVG